MINSKKQIIIAGGTGLIGSRLNQLLTKKGYKTSVLTRTPSKAKRSNFIHWLPDEHKMETQELSNCHAIVNLAGAGVMDRAWTKDYRSTILNSRIDTNKTLEIALVKLERKPILITASAIGYYGYRQGDKPFYENDSPASDGFLENVTMAWEGAAAQAGLEASRHVGVRIGLVMSKAGGAFSEMKKGFKFGVGSYFSPGDQIYSWIHIDDLCNMIIHAIENRTTQGMYNGVSPNPLSSKVIAEKIAVGMYGAARLLPVPEFALKLALGERRHTLIGSCSVSSAKIEATGFSFTYPTFDAAIQELIPLK